jgi:uncharacterized protein
MVKLARVGARLIAAAMIASSMTACAQEHRVAGRTSADLFPNEQARQLADAACNGDAEAIRQFAGQDDIINYRGVQGSSPLLWAISCNSLAGVETLLSINADPNQSALRSTPLMAATVLHDPAILTLLLDAGADPNRYPEGSEVTALRIALDVAVAREDRRNLQTLLERGADVNFPSEGSPIARMAVNLNQFPEAAMMIEHGYDGDLGYFRRRAEAMAHSTSATQQGILEARAFLEFLDDFESRRAGIPATGT